MISGGWCCGWINRGLAMLGETVYLATIDAHLVALDSRSGTIKWDVEVADYRLGFNITAAPLAVKDMIITGTSVGGLDGLSEGVLTAGVTQDQLTRLLAGTMELPEVTSLMAQLERNAQPSGMATDERRGRIDAYDGHHRRFEMAFLHGAGAGEPGNETWEGDSWRLGASSPWLTGSTIGSSTCSTGEWAIPLPR